MQRRFILGAGIAGAALLAMAGATPAGSAAGLAGPFHHGNLSVYLIRGPSKPGHTPLTLAEAMAKGVVRVHETQDVNRLEIENLGGDEVFIQSGDIVKGGQQDRVLTSSLLLAPGTGRVPLDAFCVEQGRWSQRGGENVKVFASSAAAISSRDAKLAIRAAPAPTARPGEDVGLRQNQVWRSVEKTQQSLSASLGQPMAASVSRSSLQLTLENTALAKARAAYVQALAPIAAQMPDAVGVVVAINGRLDSAEVYSSTALFRKMWPKLLDAAATEALGGRNVPPAPAPGLAEVETFLAAAEEGRAIARPLPTQGDQLTRDGPRAVVVEANARSGGWFHRSYVAK